MMRLIETPSVRAASVCVVDARPDDYAGLLEAEQSSLARLEFLPHGRDALLRARTERVDLWIVNVELPDMSGFDLCAMLKTHSLGATVYMVTDNYHPRDERTAWARGATLFGVKPVHTSWLERLDGKSQYVNEDCTKVNSCISPITSSVI